MLALMMLLALGIYLAVSTLVVWLAVRIARKLNRRGWLWGAMAAFAMYNLVFWDWIPTLVMHKYYCATEAGFWIYKTPEQWATENPGVLETLKPWPASKIYGKDKVEFDLNGGSVRQYNDRFGFWGKNVYPNAKRKILSIGRRESGLVDVKTGAFIVYSRNFISGPSNQAVWKSWLHKSTCNEGQAHENWVVFRRIINDLQIEE